MTCSKSFSALLYIKFLEEYLDIHSILFFSSHSLLDHFQSLSIPIMNRGHYFSIFVLFNLLTEFGPINSPLLIETHSASRMLLFSYPPNSLLKPVSCTEGFPLRLLIRIQAFAWSSLVISFNPVALNTLCWWLPELYLQLRSSSLNSSFTCANAVQHLHLDF